MGVRNQLRGLANRFNSEGLPETAALARDLRACLDLYRILADKDVALTEPVEVPAGEEFIEDLTRFRWHRRIDRDARAIQLVKKAKGYLYEVCGFNFESRYGELGKDFIEIHHLVPISELKGLTLTNGIRLTIIMGDYKGRVNLRHRRRRFAKNQRIKTLTGTKRVSTSSQGSVEPGTAQSASSDAP